MKLTINDYFMIGQKIKSFRKKANLTQKELARKADISFKTIQNYESNKVDPQLETLIKIAEILSCGLEDLLGKPEDYYEIKELARKYLKFELLFSTNKLEKVSNSLKKTAQNVDLFIEEIRELEE